MNDLVARFGNNQIVCLLAETTEAQAMLASQKFINNIRTRQVEAFTLHAGILQYTGKTTIEDSVFAACSDASRNGNAICINHRD